MKKLFFLVSILAFTVCSVSAQSRDITRFLGSWKLTEIKGRKNADLPVMTLNVSHPGDKIQVEKLTKDIKSSNLFSEIDLFKDNENSYVENSDRPRNGILTRRMNYLNLDKISFDKISENRPLYGTGNNFLTRSFNREIWTISQDGKLLTVEERTEIKNISDDTVAQPFNQSSSSSMKWIFEKI